MQKISILTYEQYGSTRSGDTLSKINVQYFLLKGEYVRCIIIRKGSKCSSKPEFNVSTVLLPCLVCLHHWR